MFDNPYSYNLKFKNVYKDRQYLRSRSTYLFRTEKEQYIIELEEYLYNIYIIKFFPRRLRDNSKRFNMLTREHKTGRIVATCISLLIQVLKKDSMASFGFIGSHTFDPKRQYEESKECTSRFIIYRYAVYGLIGEDTFTHFMDEKNSSYLLLNNSHKNVDLIKEQANSMFESIYPELVGI
jgi:hypothetical protein